jgi:hypothetical protein
MLLNHPTRITLLLIHELFTYDGRGYCFGVRFIVMLSRVYYVRVGFAAIALTQHQNTSKCESVPLLCVFVLENNVM